MVESGSVVDRSDARGSRTISLAHAAAYALAVLTLLSTLVVVIAHLGDRYQIDHVAGSWIGLARYLNAGTFYPELYDGSSFGGTRFMPLYFALHSVLARATVDYVLAGKALSFVILRRYGVPRSFALLLASLVLLTGPGFHAATSIRADGLATLLGLAAVALVAHRGPGYAFPASFLAGAATFTKISALWAPAAIALWLFLYHRRSLAAFAAGF